MKIVKLENGKRMVTMEEGAIVIVPTFEIISNPSFSFKEMREYRAKRLGLLVVYDEE